MPNDVFATRVRAIEAEGAYAVLAAAQKLEAQGRRIYHLELGQPDFPTPPAIAEAGAQALLSGRTRYTAPSGRADLRAAIAEAAGAQRGLHFDPSEVVVGPGTKPAMFLSTMALVEPGDEVILPDPGFPSYAAMVKVAGGIPVPVRLAPDADGALTSLDVAELEQKISPRTRLVILNSPSNPTGGVCTQADLERIAAAVLPTRAWVLSDEIYSQLVFEGSAPTIAGIPGMRERTVIVDGFSKTYAMTGWRLGYGIMPVALAERVDLLLTHSVGCTADFTQAAGVAALCGDQASVAAMREVFRARRDRVVAMLNAIPGMRCALPQGAFYALPDVRSFGRTSKWLADYLLNEANVALLAGSDFGAGGEGYLRFSYAVGITELTEAIGLVAEALGKL